MFSKNRKVSDRQIRRMIILDFFGATGLLLPAALSQVVGRDGVISIVLGGMAVVLFAIFLCYRINQFPEGIIKFLKTKNRKPLFFIIATLYILHLLIVAAFLVSLLTEVVLDMFLLNSSRGVVILISLLLCSFGVKKGIEEKGRISEIIIYFVMLPLLLMIVLAGKDVNLDYLAPIVTMGYKKIALGAYYVFAGFSTLSVLIFMGNFIKNKETLQKAVVRGVGVVIFLNLCLYSIALGFFQEVGMQTQRWPGITLISVINTPRGFLQRYDAFLVAVFLISVLVGLATCIYYGGFLLKEMVGKEKSVLRNLFTIGVFLIALWLKEYNYSYHVFMSYLWYVGTPVMVILPILFWKRREKNA